MAPPLRPESGEAQLPEAGGAHMHGAARVGQKTRHGGGQTLRRRSWGSAGSSTQASCSAPRPIRGKGEALISAAPTCSCQAGSSNRSGTREAERSVRNRTISTQPARAMLRAGAEKRAAREGAGAHPVEAGEAEHNKKPPFLGRRAAERRPRRSASRLHPAPQATAPAEGGSGPEERQGTGDTRRDDR
jgi:hypothetical protein